MAQPSRNCKYGQLASGASQTSPLQGWGWKPDPGDCGVGVSEPGASGPSGPGVGTPCAFREGGDSLWDPEEGM